MKKKRNTTYKDNHFFGNLLFTLFCLIGATFSIYLFFKSFNQALVKINEKPIATISFKYKTAQRKFLDRVIWDRLRNDSPVYNGDIIRTAPLSEATIWFSDGNVMELYENTMAQVFLNEAGVAADLTEGNVSLDSGESSKGITLNSSGNVLKIESGTKANAQQSKQGESLKVLVQEGKATLESTPVIGEQAEVHQIESGNALVVDSKGVTEKIIMTQMVNPLPNSKILYHDEKEYSVQFDWIKENFTDDKQVLLEISDSKDFSNLVYSSSFTTENSTNVNLPNGTWYYRINPVTTENSEKQVDENVVEKMVGSEGKLNLMYAPSPNLLVPSIDYNYIYRTKKPSVRFIWEENQYATSWQLEIADNQDMRNPVIQQRTSTPSSIINDLGNGTYFWRVTPYYTINNTGLKAPSTIRRFTIEQSGELNSPSLLLPINNGNLDTSSNEGFNFSWKNENEAMNYTITISKNKNLSSPILKEDISDNYYSINPQSLNINDGVYYWGVTQTDTEGNVSKISEVRSVIAAKGNLFQRTVFPPNDYSVSEGRLADISFTWKTNIPYATRYQVAKDENFKNLVIDERISLSSATAKELPKGEYYWRIKADTNEIDYSTQAKKFTIIPLLDIPRTDVPKNRAKVVVRPKIPYDFSWKAVQEAEYYSVKLYRINGKTEELAYEQNLIEGTKISIDMEEMIDGEYRWTIQAFADETENSTRRNGYLGDYKFTLKHLVPIKLLSPIDNESVDGISAIKNPGKAKWSTVEEAKNSTFYLSKNKNPVVNPIMKVKNPKKEVQLDRLQQGTYYWTIQAETSDNLDISAENPQVFYVTKIPPLNDITETTPENDAIFDVNYLRNNQKIDFSWNKIPSAEKYQFTIRDKNNKIIVDILTQDTKFTLDDIGVLDRGNFTWTIQAQNFFDKVLFQSSKTVSSDFIIDLPEAKQQKIKMNGVLYGK